MRRCEVTKQVAFFGVLALVGVLLVGSASGATVRITEWMYNGITDNTKVEYIEFTNLGGTAVDFTGWSFDDNHRVSGTVNLSAFGFVQPGQSVILTEAPAATFATDWGLSGFAIIGDNTRNLGRSDEVNLYDDGGQLVDRLTYNDQGGLGPRTAGYGGNPSSPAALGANNANLWVLSYVGDGFGSHVSSVGNTGNPGVYIPEPATLLLGLAGLALLRRR
jgi:MYXO-CTERM domain-containing protein